MRSPREPRTHSQPLVEHKCALALQGTHRTDATKWYVSAPLRDSLFAASPHRVGSCRLHALWAICSVGDSQKAQREIPVKGVAAKPCAAPLTGVSCCAMKSPPTGNAPEGLSCPQRGRRRKPEGEKLPGSERQRESGGTQGGALRHPPLRSMFQPPTPKKKSPTAEGENPCAIRLSGRSGMKKPALPLTRRAGFRYTGFSGSGCRPCHEYMRVQLTYSPQAYYSHLSSVLSRWTVD